MSSTNNSLERAVGDLLARIPDAWQEYNSDELTQPQEQALSLLVAAGMVERRGSFRIRMFGHPMAMEATFTATGESGGTEAFARAAEGMWEQWGQAWQSWKDGIAKSAPTFHCEKIGREQWRLTVNGIQARNDLKADASVVFDFVLKRGFFDGQARMMPGGRISQRLPVPGEGRLEKMEVVKADASEAGAPGVSITNWADGGKAFADAFAKFFDMMQAKVEPSTAAASPQAETSASATAGPQLKSWTQADLDNEIRKYKADRAASYAELCEAVKRNQPGAKKKAAEIYGRNAIARALGVKSTAMVSKSPAWIAIAGELGLSLNRSRRTQGTRHTQKPGKIGHDIAVEEKSMTPEAGADNAPAEQVLETAERQETIRLINKMARTGKNAREKADNQKAADALIQKLQRGDCTDDQARAVVEMVVNPDADFDTDSND